MQEVAEFWAMGFAAGLFASLLLFKVVYPFQLVKQALREVETAN